MIYSLMEMIHEAIDPSFFIILSSSSIGFTFADLKLINIRIDKFLFNSYAKVN